MRDSSVGISRVAGMPVTLEALEAVDNNVLGLVLNRVSTKSGEGTGYYGYYSDEQTLKTRGDRRKQAKRSSSRKAAV